MKRLLTLCIAVAVMFSALNTFADSPRMCVIEQFTNTACGPCASANPAFHAYIDEHASSIIPLVYHWYYPGDKDPMYQFDVTMNLNRAKYYSVNGVPACATSGNYLEATPTTHPGNLNKANVEMITEETSQVDMDINVTNDGDQYTATVNVKASHDFGTKQLQFVVMEYKLEITDFPSTAPFTNGEKEFPWVPRMMLPSEAGQAITIGSGSDETYTFTFTKKAGMKDGNIYCVAFVQNNTTREILQGCSSLKSALAEITIAKADKYSTVGRNTAAKRTVTIKNPNDFACDMQLSAVISNNWTVTFDQATVSLEAGASTNVIATVATNAAAAYSTIDITATPINTPAGYVVKSATNNMALITNDAKYATLATVMKNLDYYNVAINSLAPTFKDNWIVADADVIAENFSDLDFDIVHVLIGTTDYFGWGVDGSRESYVLDRIANGKNTLVSSNLGLYVNSGQLTQYGYIPSEALKTLYNDKLGIEIGHSMELVANNQVVTKGVKGYGTDQIAQNLGAFTINSTYSPIKFYSYYIETMTLTATSTSKPFLTYNDPSLPTNEYAGVYWQSGNSKVVYLGFGLETSTTGNAALMGNIIDWFMGSSAVEDNTNNNGLSLYPNPVVSTSTLSYGVNEFSNVNINLIDATGTTVANLVNTQVAAGNYTANIDAANLASGMYYAIVNINGQISTTPVVITK